MDCAIYTRVSTPGQVKDKFSLDAQAKAGIEFCKHRNWDYKIYREEGKSAFKDNIDNRPLLQEILDLAEDGKVKNIFVTEFDRLARPKNLVILEFIKSILRDNDVKVVTISQTFDLRDDENDFMADLLGLLAKRENKVRVRRFKRAVLEALIKGNWSLGDSCIPFGYTKKDKKLMPDPDEQKIYELMVDWSIEGKSTYKIGKLLHSMGVRSHRGKKDDKEYIWSTSSIHHLLSNPFYKGEFNFKGEHIINVPALISGEKWQQLQDSLKRNKKYSQRNNKKNFYLLKSLITCKKCGRRLIGIIRDKNRYRVYGCTSRKYKQTHCGLRSINLDRLNNLVWNRTLEIIKDKSKLEEIIKAQQEHLFVDSVELDMQYNQLNRAIKIKENELKDVIRRKNKYKTIPEHLIEEVIAEITTEKQAIEAEKQKLEEQVEKAKISKEKSEVVWRYLTTLGDRLTNSSDEEKYELLKCLISNITVEYCTEKKEHIVDIFYSIPLKSSSLPTLPTKEPAKTDPQVPPCPLPTLASSPLRWLQGKSLIR